jgi:hypothetical protein
MNDLQEFNLRQAIVYYMAAAHPDTDDLDKNYNPAIIYEISADEISDFIRREYLPEFSILLNKIENKEL